MDGPRDYHTKLSADKSEEKDKYYITSCGKTWTNLLTNSIPYITYKWYLKYNTNEHIYETEIDSQQKTDLWLPSGKRGVEGRIRNLRLADANYYI